MENIQSNKTFKNLINIFIFVLIISLPFLVFNLGKDKDRDNLISVTGFAEIYAKPDVATITLSVVSENKDLKIASSENTAKGNAIIEFLKENNIEEKDIKTSQYSVTPRYEYYNDYRNRYLAGYEIRQSLTIKVRDLEIVGDIIEGATEKGANDISNLQFVIDNNEDLKEQAREMAIKDARNKAQKLEKDLGISIKNIVNFYEDYGVYYPVMEGFALKEMSLDSTANSPSIQVGENSIVSNITIVYRVK
ncbi:MAG: SIMPL domain-containing protein [Candidatus Paceibacterota bacterium]